jgi:hypothetical protein
VVAVGDAENDHAFLSFCECAVAVANALPALKDRADIVTRGDHGHGVIEVIDGILENELADASSSLTRHDVLLGRLDDGAEVRVPAYGGNILVAGSSGAGKSSVTTGFVERLLEADYQVCVIDPEGDYASLSEAVVLGDDKSIPSADEALAVLEKPERSAVLNLIGVRFEDRPAFFQGLIGRLQDLRSRTGRPHWIIVDEAHHVLPASRQNSPLVLPQGLINTMMITVRPDHVARAAVAEAGALVALGEEPGAVAAAWGNATGEEVAQGGLSKLQRGEALLWRRGKSGPPVFFKVAPCETERVRHHRKYALGELAPESSFYFRGPRNSLKLRAHNLMTFLQMAEGVDDETWLHHLRQGEYSRWFRDAIRNEELAAEAERIESEKGLSAEVSRERIREAIERRFTIPT